MFLALENVDCFAAAVVSAVYQSVYLRFLSPSVRGASHLVLCSDALGLSCTCVSWMSCDLRCGWNLGSILRAYALLFESLSHMQTHG